jgi:hypothetical protein
MMMNLCGELGNGFQNTRGTPENPAVIPRGESAVTIPVCIRSVDPVGRTYSLEANDGTAISLPPTQGINVTFNKNLFTLAGQTVTSYPEGKFPPVLDHINVSVTADKNAQSGPYDFLVHALYRCQYESHVSRIVIYLDLR